MKKLLLGLLALLSFSFPASLCRAQDDIPAHPSCPLCGMDRQLYAHSRLLLTYDDKSAFGACSIHCAAMELALNRQKTLAGLFAADYDTKKLIDARKASWVIGGGRAGVMTSRAKWAFEQRSRAEEFIGSHGGRIAAFDDALAATFQDMYTDIKLIRERRTRHAAMLGDINDHPECKYCGMNRKSFAFSRMLVKYNDGSAVGTCSIHCSSIDLALNTDKAPEVTLVGDYFIKKLIDAERAVWVIGGRKMGVMSLRGKWAFEKKEDADAFIKENGGQTASFEEAMRATFEDMHEILK